MYRPRGRATQANNAHASVWATLTVAAFPAVAISLGWLGVDPLRSFAAGAGASLLVLLAEGITRRRWWISEPAIVRLFEDPAFSRRLLVLLGILVLLFQTFILAGFLTNRSFDVSVARLILARQCADPQHVLFAALCRKTPITEEGVRRSDAVLLAVRESAETRLLPGGLVTCAVKPVTLDISITTATVQSVIRCDRWTLSAIARQPISIASVEHTVDAALRVTHDGTYRLDGWIVGDIVPSLDATQRDALRRQTFRRAMEALNSK